jgi:hypothetical protein
MSLLAELSTIITSLGLPVETGVFSGEAPDTYTVLIPMVDTFDLHADDAPGYNIQEVRISLYSKSNYLAVAEHLTRAILSAGMCITARTYVEHEDETGYHHLSIDVLRQYEWGE